MQIQKLLSKKMTRREFLIFAGVSLIGLTGFGQLLSPSPAKKKSADFGYGTYGGTSKI